ncbi:hypothetical protein ASD68_11775 [Rhodanobacter sp. Root627]|jgi:phosphatidylserine/phosphatidylglycerophosphate/cardiolipin synthase-like enzyme|uniref:hypothetical protein n=1 Tax=Rhodanobacter sp. Root627 TaxID=1736572 RepID=UPI0006F4B277|nr:hypothetical protein [Rhodanobacter sp. Root627]KRA33630.1 hypothetical protein ASD68_11775 [Rhodanobacter sp. Root627]
MFKIAAILRKSQSPNVFRRAILSAFSGGIGDEYLICSGFFQEKKYKVNSYYASDSFIANVPPKPCKATVTTVGIYDPHTWGSQYNDFVAKLSSIKCSCGNHLSVKQRKRKGSNKWHAKVFVAKSNGQPRLAIVGSSNITKNAFDEKKGWNRECDVLIWNSSDAQVDALVRAAISGGGDQPGLGAAQDGQAPEVFISSYDAEDPLNFRRGSIQSRLELLWQDVIDASDEI